ncbi:hypothetical protein F7725_005802 [Dissostichus mawsoni]|uniref:Uncharacterized protein n=1 Tax=Dissostichus mawsoni TaxID=36200 RepID=A0A7J5YVC0_DISMA|nr:hypothetical protein F7725_005802 [Dissostichus mawsoni]
MKRRTRMKMLDTNTTMPITSSRPMFQEVETKSLRTSARSSHICPLNPSEQLHLYEPYVFWHWPPLEQGFLMHSSTSLRHLKNTSEFSVGLSLQYGPNWHLNTKQAYRGTDPPVAAGVAGAALGRCEGTAWAYVHEVLQHGVGPLSLGVQRQLLAVQADGLHAAAQPVGDGQAATVASRGQLAYMPAEINAVVEGEKAGDRCLGETKLRRAVLYVDIALLSREMTSSQKLNGQSTPAHSFCTTRTIRTPAHQLHLTPPDPCDVPQCPLEVTPEVPDEFLRGDISKAHCNRVVQSLTCCLSDVHGDVSRRGEAPVGHRHVERVVTHIEGAQGDDFTIGGGH